MSRYRISENDVVNFLNQPDIKKSLDAIPVIDGRQGSNNEFASVEEAIIDFEEYLKIYLTNAA